MREKILIMLVVGLLVNLCALNVYAQEEEPKGQLYLIHEDVVKPSMVSQYEDAAKGLVAKLKEHNAAGPSFLGVTSDDLHYSYVMKVENMAALDEDLLKELAEKMGKEQMKAMWERFDGTTESHKNFMLRLLPDLSYKPEVASMGSEETKFRHLDYLYFQTDKEEEAKEILKEWQALYQSKSIPTGYRLYVGGLGTEIPSYTVVRWAKNEVEYYMQVQKNEELLGEEAEALWQKTLAIMQKFEHKNGGIRPDLSYVPSEEMTAKE